MIGYFLFVAIFLWAALLNEQEYVKDHYFLFGTLFGFNVAHLIICGIMDHACHSTFSYWKNMIFILNIFAMFFNSLTFEIVGQRLPANDFLLTMVLVTVVCQLFLYLGWIVDLTFILKVRMFFVKKVPEESVTNEFITPGYDHESCSSYTSNNPQSRSYMDHSYVASE